MKRFIVLIALFSLILTAQVGWAQLGTLNVQGVMRTIDGAPKPDGVYSVTFRLWDAETGGNELWEETIPDVAVKNGVYNAVLGTITAFLDPNGDGNLNDALAFDQLYYLSIQVSGDNEMSPRLRLTSAPYAMALVGGDNNFPSSGDVNIGSRVQLLNDGEIVTFGPNGLRNTAISWNGGNANCGTFSAYNENNNLSSKMYSATDGTGGLVLNNASGITETIIRNGAMTLGGSNTYSGCKLRINPESLEDAIQINKDSNAFRINVNQDNTWIGNTAAKDLWISSAGGGSLRFAGSGTNIELYGQFYLTSGSSIWKAVDSGQGYHCLDDVDGDGDGAQWHINSCPSNSDRRLKQNVQPLSNNLAKVMQLQGVTFEWNQTALDRFTDYANNYSAGPDATMAETEAVRQKYREEGYLKYQGQHIGLIAQDVQQVIPELVNEDNDGFLTLDYAHLTSILVEAIKEQQALINDHETRNAALVQKTDRLEAQLQALQDQVSTLIGQSTPTQENLDRAEARQ